MGAKKAEFTEEELSEALKVITSAIGRCEKMQPKFAVGSSQHSLLRNRLKALYLSKALMSGEGTRERYTGKDLAASVVSISSIISKTQKAQSKQEVGSVWYRRHEAMIKAMQLAKSFLDDEIDE